MGVENNSILDINGNIKDFTFVLSTKDYRHLGTLQNVYYDNTNINGNLSSENEISLEVYKIIQKDTTTGTVDVAEPLWDEIVDLKSIYIPELNEYFSIQVQLDDTTDNVKKIITCKSLCESELSQVKIYGLEVNTETDIGRGNYVPTIFYNESNSDASLLDRVFSFMPQYKIVHVDKSLCNIQRTFSVDEQPIYDWLMGECANEFHCLFLFDSTKREVYVYDLYTVCNDCGYRGEYIDKCPKCNGEKLQYFGEDIDIYIDKENLTNEIQLTIDSDSIKNCFKLVAGDDIMTATIRMLNPNGSDFIFKPTDSQLSEMPTELCEKLMTYDKLCNSLRNEYEGNVADLYEAMNQINYYTHTMMPTIEHAEVTAQSEADKLTAMNLSPLGLSSVTTSTSKATVESALKNYARVFVKTGYVKLDINQSNYNYVGLKADGWNHGTWTGNFKVTNYSDEEDIVYSEVITVDVYDNYQDFVEQKIMKNIATNSDEEDSVFDVLNIDELSDFKSALELYSLNRLKSFYDAIQSAMDVLIEVDQASESADLYDVLYLPYYEKLQACQTELDARQITIDEWQNTYDNLLLKLNEMQAEMNFQDYLGEELYGIFCLYRREETYRNDNYISDGLTDSEIISKAKEFIEVAEQELEKARTPKISISSTLHNLLIVPEFKSIIKKFKLGNWLHLCVDDKIYRLMLIGYGLSGSSEESLSVEFANVSKIDNLKQNNDEILNKVQNISSTYNYITNQANKGNSANEIVNSWFEDSLKSGLVRITNNVNEEIVSDKHGLWARTYNSETGNYDPEMLRITHNILAYSDNGFKTVKTALGKHNYYKFDAQGNLVQDTAYGLDCMFVTAGYIYGTQIISGDIFSENYKVNESGEVIQGSHLALKDGSFNFGAGSLKYDVTNGLSVKGNITATSGVIGGCTIANGILKIGNANIGEKITASSIDATNLKVSAANITGQLTASQINTTGLIAENISGTTISGKTITSSTINSSTITTDSPSTLYKTVISDGNIYFYGSENETTSYTGAMCSVKINSDVGENYNGVGFVAKNKFLALGVDPDSSDSFFTARYYINNGINPLGYTEDNIWTGNERHTGVSYHNGTIISNVGSEYMGFNTDGTIKCNKILVKHPNYDAYCRVAYTSGNHSVLFEWMNDSKLGVFVDSTFIGYISLTS